MKSIASVSIIMPAYNSTRWIAETIESVRQQTHQNWQLIIIDDGSTDNTFILVQEIAKQDSRIRVLKQENSGVAAARNYGLRNISQDSVFIGFLDHDDIWHPHFLNSLIHNLELAPQAVGIHGLASLIDESGSEITTEDPISGQRRFFIESIDSEGRTLLSEASLENPTDFKILVTGDCLWTLGQGIFRRTILDEIGSFDTSTTPADDWDYLIRISRIGDILFLNEKLIKYRIHGAQQSKSNPHIFVKGRCKIFLNLLDTALSPFEFQATLKALCSDIFFLGHSEVLKDLTAKAVIEDSAHEIIQRLKNIAIKEPNHHILNISIAALQNIISK